MPCAVSRLLMAQSVSNYSRYVRNSRVLQNLLMTFGGLTLVFLTGCTSHQRYVEEYEIRQLKVVFLDERSLHERWTHIAGRDAVRFSSPMASSTPMVQTVRGFYDYATNTLYCEKWNFEVCGHELHHATLGQFHPEH